MAVFVCGLNPNGAAYKAGQIQIGDEILEVSEKYFAVIPLLNFNYLTLTVLTFILDKFIQIFATCCWKGIRSWN